VHSSVCLLLLAAWRISRHDAAVRLLLVGDWLEEPGPFKALNAYGADEARAHTHSPAVTKACSMCANASVKSGLLSTKGVPTILQ